MAKYVLVRSGGWRWRVAEDHAAAFRDGPFSRLEDLAAGGRLVKDLRHKKTIECRIGDDVYFLKIYKASTWWRKFKVYSFGCRSWHELEMSNGLLRRGLPTVPVTAAGQSGAQGCVVIERLDGWSQLEDVLLDARTPPAVKRRLLFEYGQFARQIHDAGVWQYDFNASNILVKEWGAAIELKVIDFEKMKMFSRIPEPVRLRSISKINRLPKLSRTDRLRFLEGYVHKYPEDQRRMREIISEITRQSEALNRRATVKILRNCVQENRNYGVFDSGEVCGYYRKRHTDAPEGLAPEEIGRLGSLGGNGVFRCEATDHALHDWKRANQELLYGGAAPIAVVVRKGEEKGALVWRA